MIDNTHVVVLRGSGRDMVPVPEMAAFAEGFGFQFVAHAIGNANRSARVERPCWFIENNFLGGRTFSSWEDLNSQARQWCDKVNATYKKHIRAVPRELFAVERLHLKPLPSWIPDVYRLQQRLVDVEGYIAVHTNRYSVPLEWIGRRVEVRETKDKIEIQLVARRLVTHRRIAGYLNLKPEQSNIFFKLMEERYRQHSTIITTNLVYDEWPNFLGNRPMVEALLSRLRHFCHTVVIDGPSLREPQGLGENRGRRQPPERLCSAGSGGLSQNAGHDGNRPPARPLAC